MTFIKALEAIVADSTKWARCVTWKHGAIAYDRHRMVHGYFVAMPAGHGVPAKIPNIKDLMGEWEIVEPFGFAHQPKAETKGE